MEASPTTPPRGTKNWPSQATAGGFAPKALAIAVPQLPASVRRVAQRSTDTSPYHAGSQGQIERSRNAQTTDGRTSTDANRSGREPPEIERPDAGSRARHGRGRLGVHAASLDGTQNGSTATIGFACRTLRPQNPPRSMPPVKTLSVPSTPSWRSTSTTFSAVDQRWRRRNRTYHSLIQRISRLVVPPGQQRARDRVRQRRSACRARAFDGRWRRRQPEDGRACAEPTSRGSTSGSRTERARAREDVRLHRPLGSRAVRPRPAPALRERRRALAPTDAGDHQLVQPDLAPAARARRAPAAEAA